MAPATRSGRRRAAISISTILLAALLLALAAAGGASRADALGQAIVRPVAAVVLAALIVARADIRLADHRWPALLLGAIVAVPLIQLVPLPPALWQALPGRAPFVEVATLAGTAQPWRPIAIVPDAALNALLSLLVPAAAMALAMSLTARERAGVPGMIFALAGVSAFVALLQLSGAGVDNPLINETRGMASGIFANPNHQALLLAIGLLAGAAWAARARAGHSWRIAVAAGGAIWFLLMILATGSRTGLAMGSVAAIAAGILARPALQSLLDRLSRRLRLALGGAALAGLAGLVVLSFSAGRAVSLNRLLVLSTGEDMRSRALPTVLDMIGRYMPFGSGVGGFDPLFRMHEPDRLLKLTYFNHAHNDYLEVALATGVAGVILMLLALVWIGWMAVAAWRPATASVDMIPARFGAATLILIVLASAVDYPLRTPTVMALAAIALVLANRGAQAR